MTLPAAVHYGTVTATFPDPPPGLQVRFRPDLRQPIARLATVSPPLTFAVDEIIATIDGSGQLLDPAGTPGVRLLTHPDLEPHAWTWRVRISSSTTAPVEFSIAVTADTTVDLSSVVPVPPDLGAALTDWLAAVTAAQAARDEAARIAGTVAAGSAAAIQAALASLVGAAPDALNTLQEIDAQLAADEGSAAALAALVATRAPLASPTFTGTVSGITAAMVGADAAGAASAAQGASLQKNANLTDLASASAARTALGLGSAATHPVTDFDPAGAAAAVTLASLGGITPAAVAATYLTQANAGSTYAQLRGRDIRNYVNAGETLVSDGSGPGNNSTILNRAITALSTLAATTGQAYQVYVPDGRYVLAQTGTTNSVPFAIQCATKVGIKGESEAGTVFLSDAGSTPFFGAYGSAGSPLTDCQFETFTIDCAAQTNGTYTTQLKGMFIQFMVRPRWTHVTIKNAWATGLGCDFLQDAVIDHPTCTGNGRGIAATGSDPAAVSGGSGIGIGTGYTQVERILITNPTLTNNGRLGLFFEKQTSVTYYSQGTRVVGGVCQGNWGGMQDCGLDGLNADITLIDNTYGLILDGSSLSAKAGRNGRITIQAERNSTGNVLLGKVTDGGYTVRGIARASTAGPGVLTTATSTIGPRMTLDLVCDSNAGSGHLIQSTSPITALTIAGTARENGQSGTPTYRDGVTILTATDMLEVTAKCVDEQATPTQQAGIALRGASTVNANRAKLTGDARGNVTAAAVLSHTISNDSIVTIGGSDTSGPSNLTVTGVAGGQVSLQWSPPIPAGTVTDYAIQYKLTTDSTWTLFAHTASNSTARTVTGLTNGSAYQFQVAAVTAGGTGTYTAGPVTATPAIAPMFTDTFTRADNASSIGSTDGGTASATAWTVSASTTWKILANYARPASGGTSVAWLDTANTNGTISFTIGNLGATIGGRVCDLVWRYQDDSNYYFLAPHGNSSANFYTLSKKVAGTNTVLLQTTVQPAVGDTVKVIVNGSTFTIYVNGVSAGSVTDATLTTGTKVGMRGSSSADGTSKVGKADGTTSFLYSIATS